MSIGIIHDVKNGEAITAAQYNAEMSNLFAEANTLLDIIDGTSGIACGEGQQPIYTERTHSAKLLVPPHTAADNGRQFTIGSTVRSNTEWTEVALPVGCPAIGARWMWLRFTLSGMGVGQVIHPSTPAAGAGFIFAVKPNDDRLTGLFDGIPIFSPPEAALAPNFWTGPGVLASCIEEVFLENIGDKFFYRAGTGAIAADGWAWDVTVLDQGV